VTEHQPAKLAAIEAHWDTNTEVGAGRIYKTISNAYASAGDGPAIAYRVGAALEDMEFVQFHPTGIYKLGIHISEAARGEGGILRNRDGKRLWHDMRRFIHSVGFARLPERPVADMAARITRLMENSSWE